MVLCQELELRTHHMQGKCLDPFTLSIPVALLYWGYKARCQDNSWGGALSPFCNTLLDLLAFFIVVVIDLKATQRLQVLLREKKLGSPKGALSEYIQDYA